MAKEKTPHSLREALSLRRSSKAQPVMGGLASGRGDGAVKLLLRECEEFTRIDTDGTWVHIGAGCTAAQLKKERLTPELLRSCAGMCPEKLREGSLGGAVCAGSPMVLCALEALDCRVTVASECGRRTMPLRSFRRGGGNLASDELLCEILVPESRNEGWVYEKNAEGLTFAATIRWEKRRIAALTVAFALPEGQIVRYREFEREMLGKSAREAKELRSELVAAYRRWWPVKREEEREALLERLERFLLENKL